MMKHYDLDTDVRAFVDQCLSAFDETSARLSAEEQRRRYNELCRLFDHPCPDSIDVAESVVTTDGYDVPIRIYRPRKSNILGCLLYFHGGGWVVGNLDSHNAITAEIASRANVVVIAVDYRLAPEHVYPTGHEDCWAVVDSVVSNPQEYHVDPARIAVGGDSAGAHIAAGMTRRARDRNYPDFAGQVLIYGAFGGERTLPSYTECHDAPLLSTADIDSYHDIYWPDGPLPDDAMACPLATESMAKLPPAFIQAAEYDPLRDDSVEYARRLEAAGVSVELHVETGLLHGYLRSRHVTLKGARAFDKICAATHRLLS